MLKSIVGSIFGSSQEAPQPKSSPEPAPSTPTDDEDPILTDSEQPSLPPSADAEAKQTSRHTPARAVKRAGLQDSAKKSLRWKKLTAERERTKKIKALTQELKEEMERESQQTRENRKRQLEQKMQKEKEAMTVEKISRTKAMKKLSPSARKRIGVYAQHELSKMLEERNRR